MSDLPRDELIRRAQEVIDASAPGAFVFFKFTCEQCGERCVLEQANTLWERGECCKCGHEMAIREGGFMLAVPVEAPEGDHVRAAAARAMWN